jgi:hypothetical protein
LHSLARVVEPEEADVSQRSVERALGKLLTDDRFRERFSREPEAAAVYAGLELTADEIDALMRVPLDALDRLCRFLDDRICRLVPPREPA